MKKICPTCGKEFVTTRANKIYCSHKCAQKLCNVARRKPPVLVKKICRRCGKEFETTRPTTQIYCSRACNEATSNSKYRSRRKPREKRICPVCGVEFMQTNPKQKYCSVKCTQRSGRLKRHGATKICPTCGKEFTPTANAQKFCSVKCTKPVVYKLTCRYCGQKFESKNPAQLYCNERCREKYHKTHQKNICPICDKEYRGGRKFCPECMEAIYSPRSAQVEVETQPKPTKPLSEWISEARECNMDYGTYRAQIEVFGKTFAQCKAMNKQVQIHSPHSPNSRWKGE